MGGDEDLFGDGSDVELVEPIATIPVAANSTLSTHTGVHPSSVSEPESVHEGAGELFVDDWEQDGNDAVLGEMIEHPLLEASLESGSFGADWIEYMETLEILQDEDLYQQESTDGYLPVTWRDNADRLVDCLNVIGLTDRLLAYQRGSERLILEQALLQLGVKVSMKEFAWHERQLISRVTKLESSLPIAKRLRGDSLQAEHQRMQDASFSRGRVQEHTPSIYLGQMVLEESLRRPLRGCRSKQKDPGGGASVTREERDRLEKLEWSKQVTLLLRKVGAPIIEIAASSGTPSSILEVSVGATRGSTMRTYLQSLKPFISYLEVAANIPWTDDVVQVLEFLRAAAMKPCCPTYPKKFQQALAWIMKTGGWQGDSLLAEHALVVKAVDYWSEALFSQVHPLKQAPRIPWVVIAALELYLTNERNPAPLRYKAFTVLLKAVATLREDDIQHMGIRKLRTLGDLLITELMKSKTTGASKRVRQLPVALHTGWTITRSLWIEHGLALAADLVPKDADYTLPAFDKGGNALKEPISYTGSAALTRRLFSELKVPKFDAAGHKWVEGERHLLSSSLTTFWTEHSARAVMPSAAQLLGISKEARDCLGRWCPTGADDYSRAYRTTVGLIQMQIMKAVLSQDEKLGEDEILDRITQLTDFGTATPEKAGEMRSHLEVAIADFKVQLGKAGAEVESEDMRQPTVDRSAEMPKPVAEKLRDSKELGRRRPRFLVVYSRNRKGAKLHRIGGCSWTLVTLNDSQEFDAVNSKMYDSRCRLCWPPHALSTDASDDQSASDVSDV